MKATPGRGAATGARIPPLYSGYCEGRPAVDSHSARFSSKKKLNHQGAKNAKAGSSHRKILCRDLTCLIREQETLGITPVPWKDEEEAGPSAMLPTVRPE